MGPEKIQARTGFEPMTSVEIKTIIIITFHFRVPLGLP